MKGGSNSILILDKDQMKLLNSINLYNWLSPGTLKIDNFFNIYVTALKVDQNKKVSSNKSLFVFNEESTLVNEFVLTSSQVYDMAVYKNSLFIGTSDYDLFVISNFVFN